MSTNKMTKEQLFYHKLRNDRKWYIENFLKIRDKSAQIIPFKLNKAQNIVLDILKKRRKRRKTQALYRIKGASDGSFYTF